MSTLNGLGGAGALIPASVVAPMLASPSLSCAAAFLGARSSARAPRTISAGTVVRSISASPSSFAGPGSGFALHGMGGPVGAGSRAVSNSTVVMSTPEMPSTSAWWVLAIEREAPAGHVLHEPDLPQRLGAVEALGEEPPGEALERGVVGGAWQRGVADVVVGVEVWIVGPHRPSLAERHVCEPLTVARYQVQPAEHVIDEFLQGRRLALEHHHRRHVHVGVGVILEV